MPNSVREPPKVHESEHPFLECTCPSFDSPIEPLAKYFMPCPLHLRERLKPVKETIPKID